MSSWYVWLKGERGRKSNDAESFLSTPTKIVSVQFRVKTRKKMRGNDLDKIAQANVQNFLTFLSFSSLFLLSFDFF